jgi:membrane-bound lytic murein transglycosylase D
MRALLLSLLIAAPLARAFAQQEAAPPDVLKDVDAALNEVDDTVLDLLGIDRDRARSFVRDVQKQFEGTYVYDLGAWRDTARTLQPILANYEETAPYAAWLKAHLDYFEVSQVLRAEVKTNAARLPVPAPQVQRAVWVKVIEDKPPARLDAKQFARLKEIFREEKVPAELVWIGEVESSFDAKARSPAGAAGMFQLMPATARSLDLSVGLLRDERLDAEKSARAAAKYLRRLHTRFGDWRLAFAAYNAGEGRVADLLKKHKARTFDEIARYLPLETQMYVPKLEATLKTREGWRAL